MSMRIAIGTMACFLLAGSIGSGQPGQAAAVLARQELEVDKTIDILLADDELTPARVTLEEGRYRFRLNNAFTSNSLTLRIDDDKSVRVKEMATRAFAAKGSIIEVLKPGRYVVSIAQRPKWRVDVEVTTKKR
jgi:hypothetical protein